jgi:hypothetical protein
VRGAVVLALCTVLSFPNAGDAQQALAAPSAPPETLDELRGRQARFERLRRRRLPATLAGTGGRCDHRIGRICEWAHDDDALIERLGDEDERTTQARERLRGALSEAARRFPGDPWIAGQRLRYAIDAGSAQEAVAVAHQCRAKPSWCMGLRAFAAHAAGRYVEADSRYADMLAQLPDTARCAWTDLTLLLERDLRARYGPLSCADRDSVNAILWQVADPLYLVPGNERRTEHYARFLWHLLLQGTETPYALRWGDDFREVLIRYGRHDRWAHVTGGGLTSQPRIVGLQRHSGEPFLPRVPLLDEGMVLPPHGDPGVRRWARERYAPDYAREWRRLPHQLAVFRGRSGWVLVAAVSIPRQPGETANAQSIDAALAVPRAGAAPLVADTTLSPEHAARLVLRRAELPAVVSVEALDRRDSVAYRSRRWVDAPAVGSFALSDILLVEHGDSPPSSLDDAAARARPTTTYAPGEPIHLYWEAYAADTVPPVAVTITVVQRGRSVFRRAAEWLGLMDPRGPALRLSWERGGQPRGRRWPGAVTVSLPTDVRGGVTVRLEIVRADGTVARTTRDIVVTESDASHP